MTYDKTNEMDSPPVQLGYCVEIEDSEEPTAVGHVSPKWSSWDGGKVGGKPSWLSAQNIPSRLDLQCEVCSNGDDSHPPLRFVAQIYCPADEDAGNENAFHRTLYVFVCPDSRHNQFAESGDGPQSGGVKVLRQQLPRNNPYYPLSCRDKSDAFFMNWNKHTSREWGVNLCVVCGILANGKCPIQQEYFCGKAHQKEHMKYVHKVQGPLTNLPSIFNEFELVVEEEPAEGEVESSEQQQIQIMEQIQEKALFKTDTNDQEDAALEQTDLNAMVAGKKNGGVSDLQTIEFYSRITIGGKSTSSQCLRYCRWPNFSIEDDKDCQTPIEIPLWIRSDCIPPNIPPCPHCGGERAFEFQIMPQMLSYILKKDQNAINRGGNITKEVKDATIAAAMILEKDQDVSGKDEAKALVEQRIQQMANEAFSTSRDSLDWGTIAVYTCVKSCDTSEAGFVTEYPWRQPALD